MSERVIWRYLRIRGETVVLTVDLEEAARVLYFRALTKHKNEATALERSVRIKLHGVEPTA